MKTVTAANARTHLGRYIDEVIKTQEPIRITSEHGDVILIPADVWFSLQETLALQSIPGMAESIREGITTPIEDLEEDLIQEDPHA